MEDFRDISHLRGIFRRRKKSFLFSSLSLLFLGFAIAFLLPPSYRSQSTILIENQLIPPEYVQTTITGFVEERLQVITQQVMSRTRLMEIVNQFDLYEEMRERYTTEEIIERMRRNIGLRTISADVGDSRKGRASAVTIAFTLSYQGRDPAKVQKVANVLASLYLEENLRTREQRASTTTVFLDQEAKQIQKRINELQGKISDFKKAHVGELSEYNSVNMQAITRLERDLGHLDMQINSLKERKILLESQISQVDPLSAVTDPEGREMMNPVERLKYLRLRLLSLQGTLSEKHPDVKQLKREIEELEAEVETSDDVARKIQRLNEMEGQLAEMRGKYGLKHPDVINLEKQKDAMAAEMEELGMKNMVHKTAEQNPDNPAYISLKTQIAATELEIKNLLKERREIQREIEVYQTKLENAPLLEKEYLNIFFDLQTARNKHSEIMNKLLEARVAQGMEASQRGERFTIIDPAQLPQKPYKPNRIAIVIISLVLALGGGIALAAARETLDLSVKSANQLRELTGLPVMSTILFIQTDEEKRRRRIRRLVLGIVFGATVVVGLILIHKHVMPLEILWIKMQKRMFVGL